MKNLKVIIVLNFLHLIISSTQDYIVGSLPPMRLISLLVVVGILVACFYMCKELERANRIGIEPKPDWIAILGLYFITIFGVIATTAAFWENIL